MLNIESIEPIFQINFNLFWSWIKMLVMMRFRKVLFAINIKSEDNFIHNQNTISNKIYIIIRDMFLLKFHQAKILSIIILKIIIIELSIIINPIWMDSIIFSQIITVWLKILSTFPHQIQFNIFLCIILKY